MRAIWRGLGIFFSIIWERSESVARNSRNCQKQHRRIYHHLWAPFVRVLYRNLSASGKTATFPRTVSVKPARPATPARQWKPPFCLTSTGKSQVCWNFAKVYRIILKGVIEELTEILTNRRTNRKKVTCDFCFTCKKGFGHSMIKLRWFLWLRV